MKSSHNGPKNQVGGGRRRCRARNRSIQKRPPRRLHASKDIATWKLTEQNGERHVDWSSRDRWEMQSRPERGREAAGLPQPFRHRTLCLRHSRSTVAPSEGDPSKICRLCYVPEIHGRTHRAGSLHREREAGERLR